jgi:diadenosine tetraphosphate (Ap4A) HIT family hydrolase
MACPFCDAGSQAERHVATLTVSRVYVHPDQYYRGRCLLVLKEHWESFAALPDHVLVPFARDVRVLTQVIEGLFRPALINVALLGNKIRHLHWHVIPRYRDQPNFNAPPWPQPHSDLDPKEWNDVRMTLIAAFTLYEPNQLSAPPSAG